MHDHTRSDLNLNVALQGVLRVEASSTALNVVFLAHTTATAVTLARESTYVETAWRTLAQLTALNSDLGRPPWPPGKVGLQTTTLLDWARYVDAGATVAPLHFLSLPADRIWYPQLGGSSEAHQREQQSQSLQQQPQQPQSQQQQQQQQQQPVMREVPVTSTPVGDRSASRTSKTAAAAAAALKKQQDNNGQQARGNSEQQMRERQPSVVIDIPPPPPPSGFTDGDDAATATASTTAGAAVMQLRESQQLRDRGHKAYVDPKLCHQ